MLFPLAPNSLTLILNELPSYLHFAGDWSYTIPKDFIQAVLTNNEIDKKTGKPFISDICKTCFKNNIVSRLKNDTLTINWAPVREVPYGRRYPGKFEDKKPVGSLGSSARAIKNSFYKREGWTDFDFVKCHPSLLLEIAKLSKIEISRDLAVLKEYIANFDSISKELISFYSIDKKRPLDTDDVKSLFNITIYGGGFSTWTNWMETDDPVKNYIGKKVKKDNHPFYIRFKNCISDFRKKICEDNTELLNLIKQKNSDNSNYEHENSLMSYFLQTAENHCLYYAYCYAVDREWIEPRKADLCYDGFTAKLCDGHPDINIIESDINKYLADKTGIAIQIKKKDFKDFVPSIVNPLSVNTDEEAGTLLYNLLKDVFVCDLNERLFYKNGNVWISTPTTIETCVMEFILKSGISKKTTQGKTIPFSQNISGAKNIYQALIYQIRIYNKCDIYEKFHSTTRGKICFNDGVLDFVNRSFLTWEEIAEKKIEIYTCACIPYDYGEYHKNPDFGVMEEIKTKIFDNMFGDKTQTALHFLGRAIAGFNVDKNWATYLGSRDCGKGVIYEALKSAFGEYVATFELGNLLYQRQTDTNEISRKLYWLMPLEFVRLAISQETPPPEKGLRLNCTMMKKLAGGGDTHVARRNYDRVDTHFTIDATFMTFGNDDLVLDSKDANEHRIQFASCNQFKTITEIDAIVNDMIESGGDEESIENLRKKYKIRDPNIKSSCVSLPWKLALVRLVYDYYRNCPVDIEFQSEDCDIPSLCKNILLNYKITKDKMDECLISDVYAVLQENKKKIDAELEGMGIKKVKSINHSGKYVFRGLIQKEKPPSSAPVQTIVI